jgi:chromosome segregation ATPase
MEMSIGEKESEAENKFKEWLDKLWDAYKNQGEEISLHERRTFELEGKLREVERSFTDFKMKFEDVSEKYEKEKERLTKLFRKHEETKSENKWLKEEVNGWQTWFNSNEELFKKLFSSADHLYRTRTSPTSPTSVGESTESIEIPKNTEKEDNIDNINRENQEIEPTISRSLETINKLLKPKEEQKKQIIDIIQKLCAASENGNASRNDIVNEAEKQGIESREAENILDRLSRNGQIFEPINGKYKVGNSYSQI